MPSSRARLSLVCPVMPTIDEIARARQLFEEYEPRDLFYRVATELIELALDGRTSVSVAEALSVLLQTWNAMYYRFHPFDSKHFSDIEKLITANDPQLKTYRNRSIESLTDADAEAVQRLFADFEIVLGPVGAAKSLHLLAPYFFPLWDVTIAKKYIVSLDRVGFNSPLYFTFMKMASEQVKRLGLSGGPLHRGPLKQIDEYNYCRFTKGWL
jgi:hypothetical protein